MQKPLRKIPLRWVLVLPFVIQISLAVGITGWLSFRNGRHAINDLANQILSDVSARIQQHLASELSTSHLVNRINLDLMMSDRISDDDLVQLHQHFWQQLQQFDTLSVIYYGSSQGRFIAAQRLADGSFITVQRERPPAPANVFTVDESGQIGEKRFNIDGFIDIRQRPWYVAAREADTFTWGEIFALQVTPSIDIPASVPVHREDGELKGVLGNNLSLNALSDFLGGLEIGDRGQTFIIERSGALVASSELPAFIISGTGETQRIQVDDSDDPHLSATTQAISEELGGLSQVTTAQQIDIMLHSERHFVEVAPYTDEYGLDWLTIVVVPERDFLSAIYANTRTTLLLCAMALVLAIYSSVLTARWLSRPLRQLNQAAKKVADGHFEHPLHTSRIQEVAELADSFTAMTAQLNGSFNRLQALNQALKDSESRLSRFLEALPIAVVVYEPNGQAVYINSAGRSLLRPANHTIQTTSSGLSISLRSAAESQATAQNASQAAADAIADLAWTVDCELHHSVTHDTYSLRDSIVLRSLRGENWQSELFELRGDNRSIPLSIAAAPIRDAMGHIGYAIATIQDISDRKQAQENLENLAENMPGVLFRYILHPDGRYSMPYVSAGCHDVWEIEAAQPQLLWEAVHPDDREALQASLLASAETLSPWSYEWRIIVPSGQEKWLKSAARTRRLSNHSILWDGLVLDISDRKRTEAALQQSETRFRNLAANLPGAVLQYVLCADGTDRITYMSPGCSHIWELTSDDIQHSPDCLWQMIHPDDVALVQQSIAESARLLQPWQCEWRITTPSGQLKWLQAMGQPARRASNEIVWDTLILDVSDRKRAEERLIYNALHDSLTDLPNRQLLMEQLAQILHHAQRTRQYDFAVLFLDLDRFKVVNDSLGHLAGDQLLITVAQTLSAAIDPTHLIARLGGDEFVVVVPQADHSVAIRVANQILEMFRSPLFLDERDINLSTSIGIVMGDVQYTEASDLLRDADIALYQAKAKGRSRYEIFDGEMHLQIIKRLHLENDLRRAIAHQELAVYYQPIVDLNTLTLNGFEALVRWNHPTRGRIYPDDFIPIAEETGLICALDRWVLETSCWQLATWNRQFPNRSLKISVNLSVVDLRDPNLLPDVQRILNDTGIDSRRLTFEITESMLMDNISDSLTLLYQLKDHGINISIDDFGTGHSSLSYLHQLPVDILKVDRSFVHKMQHSGRNHRIVQTILSLSHQLGIQAVAEGIDNLEHVHLLRELRCEFGQGYFFARPVTVPEADALISIGTFVTE